MSANKITIELNGEPFVIEEGICVQELLEQLKLRTSRIAVALNREVLLKAQYPSVRLKQNDKVEIVNFVGGG